MEYSYHSIATNATSEESAHTLTATCALQVYYFVVSVLDFGDCCVCFYLTFGLFEYGSCVYLYMSILVY